MPVSKNYLYFLMERENAPLLKGDTSSIVHPSREGGTPTLGYGHKLTPAEIKANKVYGYNIDTLTREDAMAILQEDVRIARDTAAKNLKKMQPKADFGKLRQDQQEMLIDYAYNLGGLTKFPKFTEAVVNDDPIGMSQEFTRHVTLDGKKVPMVDRNDAFFEKYIAPKLETMMNQAGE